MRSPVQGMLLFLIANQYQLTRADVQALSGKA